MAKQIKKAHMARTEEEKAALKIARAEKLQAKIVKMREAYTKSPDVTTMKSNRKVLAALLNKPALTWTEYCEAKRTASNKYWEAAKLNPKTGRVKNPLTREQVTELQERLKKKAEKLAQDQAMLKEAMALLGQK